MNVWLHKLYDYVCTEEGSVLFGGIIAVCWFASYAALLFSTDLSKHYCQRQRCTCLVKITHHGKLSDLLAPPTPQTKVSHGYEGNAFIHITVPTKTVWTSFYAFAAVWNLAWFALLPRLTARVIVVHTLVEV